MVTMVMIKLQYCDYGNERIYQERMTAPPHTHTSLGQSVQKPQSEEEEQDEDWEQQEKESEAHRWCTAGTVIQ